MLAQNCPLAVVLKRAVAVVDAPVTETVKVVATTVLRRAVQVMLPTVVTAAAITETNTSAKANMVVRRAALAMLPTAVTAAAITETNTSAKANMVVRRAALVMLPTAVTAAAITKTNTSAKANMVVRRAVPATLSTLLSIRKTKNGNPLRKQGSPLKRHRQKRDSKYDFFYLGMKMRSTRPHFLLLAVRMEV